MKQAVRRWARILVGAGILAILLWRVGSAAFLEGLRVINVPAVVAALAIGLATTVASAARWCLVVRRLGLRLSLTTATGDYYRAQFLNTVLPGGVLGDVHRAVRHGRDSGDVGRGVRAVVIERTGGQVVLAAAGIAVLFTRPGTARAVLSPAVVATLAGLVVTLAAVAWWGHRTQIWRRLVTPVLSDVRLGLLARNTWPGVMALSAAALAGHLALFFVSAHVVGVVAPATRLLPLMVLALFAMGLPVNVGGWGPREGVLAWAFGAAGLGAAQGVTVSVVYGVLTFVACLPGAVVLVVRRFAEAEIGRRAVTTESEPVYRHAPPVPRRVLRPGRDGADLERRRPKAPARPRRTGAAGPARTAMARPGPRAQES